MDRLSQILNSFRLRPKVIFVGNLCELTEFDASSTFGQEICDEPNHGHGIMHIFKAGSMVLIDHQGKKRSVGQPCILLFAHGSSHRILPDPTKGADIISASINYNDLLINPIVAALPPFLKLQLSRFPELKRSVKLLFKEAFDTKCGREPLLDAYSDICMIQILREVLDHNLVQDGMFAGLGHQYLAEVITQIHCLPEYPWTLESMADLAFMSRSKFADLFREVVGTTPGDYLSDWRMNVAQNALLKGDNVNVVAEKVGYENGSALARAFRKKVGMSPKAWQQKYKIIH